MLEHLINWDFTAFELVHLKWHTAFLDYVLPFLRNAYFWGPLYIFLAFFMVQNFGKQGGLWVLFLFITFVFSDFFSATLLKPIFHRIRPCVDPYWAEVHRRLVPNSYGFSFPSTHATNHFGLSMFIAITCGKFSKWVTAFAMLWAVSVAYAQVYVGVHYPLDVMAGAFIGIWLGYITGNYFNMRSPL